MSRTQLELMMLNMDWRYSVMSLEEILHHPRAANAFAIYLNHKIIKKVRFSAKDELEIVLRMVNY